MNDLPDNVVAIQTRFNEAAPIEVRPRDWLGCSHEHTTIDEVLRVVSCRDCGEERLDAFEVLVHLARTWGRWHREAEKLRELNAEYYGNEKAKWERARDRHLGSNPAHAAMFNAKVLARGDPTGRLSGDSSTEFACEQCWRIFLRHDYRWIVRRAPEPPSGRLENA